MMYSAYKLNKQGDNIKSWRTPFPSWNQSVVSCPILTIAYWPACIFLKRQVRWFGIPISFRIFQFVVTHTVKGFGIVNKAEINVFLEPSCFFNDPADVGNLIASSSSFIRTSLNTWKFTVHVLLKPGLENFKHHFTSMWDEWNCPEVWAFFGISSLWDWNENWPFPVAQSCPTLCDPMDCRTSGFPVHHQLPELTQTHVYRISDAIQPSHPLLSPLPPAFNLSQHQSLFKWVSSSHQVAKVLELQLQQRSSNEHSGLISFRMDWLDLLVVQRTLKSILQYHSSKLGY